jgi:hypothetical protein
MVGDETRKKNKSFGGEKDFVTVADHPRRSMPLQTTGLVLRLRLN